MAAELDIWCDVVNRRLVTGLSNKEAFQIPVWYQGDQIAIRFYPVKPTLTVIPPFYTKAAIDNFTLKMHFGPRAGNESLLVSQASWTKVYDSGASGTGYLSATLDLNTVDLNNAIGTSDTYSTFFEIKLSESGVERTVWQQSAAINAVVQGPGSGAALPTPAAEYFTKTEMLNILTQYVRFAGNANGATIETSSPNGTRKRITGVRNDGSAQDDII